MRSESPASLEGDILAKGTDLRLPGARVMIQGTAGHRETLSDAQGHYRFAAVTPGEYEIGVSREGFTTAALPGVLVPAGQARTIHLFLEVQRTTQTVMVTAEAVETPRAVAAVTASDLQKLPSNGRNATRFALLDPHVRHTQGLASDGAAAARLSINAASFRHTHHEIDGVSNYDAVFANAPQQSVPVAAIQEIAVLSNPYSAEYGGSTAGTVAASTRGGGDAFHGEAFGFLRPSGIQARPPLSSLRVPNQRWQYGAAAGGPAVAGKTWWFGAYDGTRQERGSFIQSPAPRTFTGQLDEWLALGRVDHRVNERHSVAVRVNAQHSGNTNTNDRIGGFTQPSAAQLSYTQSGGAQATWRWIGTRWYHESRVAYTAYTPSATRSLEPSVSIVRPSYSTDGGSSNSWVHVRSGQWSEAIGAQFGRHAIAAGAEVQHHSAADYSFTPFGEYRFAAGPPVPGQNPLQYTHTFGQALLHYGQTSGAVFVQDNWRIAAGVTANLGLRYERQSLTDDRNNLAPRAAVSWDVRGDGRTVLRAGGGMFYDQYYFYIARRFLLQGIDSPTATYTIPYGAAGFPVFPASLTAPPEGAQSGKRDLYLRPERVLNPYSLQWSVGLRQELGDHWVFSMDAVHSHTLKQMRANDLNAPAPFRRTAPGQSRTVAQADATRPLTVWEGVPVRNVLMIDNSGSSLYQAVDVGVARQFGRRYQLRANYVCASSATYSMFFGEPNTGIPNEWSNTGSAERAPSDFHQRHRFVLVPSVELPRGILLAGVATAGSGLPVNALTGVDNNGDTYPADRPVAMGRNAFRGPRQASIDVAASKRIRLREALNLELRAEAFNLLNRNNYLKLNGTYGDGARPGAQFLTPVAGLQNVDPSRQLQLALRLTW